MVCHVPTAVASDVSTSGTPFLETSRRHARASGGEGSALLGSAHSRSTSASSSSAKGSASASDGPTVSTRLPSIQTTTSSSSSVAALPDYDYPVPLIVKNTFLCAEHWRPSSLDGFFRERHTRSCVSRIGWTLSPTNEGRESPCKTEEEEAEFHDACETAMDVPPSLALEKADDRGAAPFRQTLALADDLALSTSAPAPAAALPSQGSTGHFDGTCNPCAFFHTKGCKQGVLCPFCHLCDSLERKKRRKEKISQMRAARAAAAAAAAGAATAQSH